MPSSHPSHLLTAADYIADVTSSINRAKTRIAVVATTLHADDPLAEALVDALCAAATRGLTVSVCIDAYTYIEPKEFLLKSPRRHPKRAYRALKVERRLKKQGVDFHWLGRTTNFALTGRTHSKWTIVDDCVYSFGGVNLDRASFANTDYMLKMVDAVFADALYSEHLDLIRADRSGRASKSRTLTVSPSMTVLLDGGMPGNSLIYRRACSLAKQANEITLVSQFCPTGTLGRILKRKKATLYFNHWREAEVLNKVLIQVSMLFTRHKTLYQREQYLHAKCMIFTMSNGSKVALSGSHNFVYGGVLLGTREIALETTDQTVIQQLESFITHHVAGRD